MTSIIQVYIQKTYRLLLSIFCFFCSVFPGTPPSTEVPVGTYPYMVTSEEGRKVPVVQAYAFGKYLGYLKVSFDDAGNVVKSTGNPILLDSSIKQGNEAESAIFVLRFLFFTRFLVPSLCCWRISDCSCHRVTGHMRDLWRLCGCFASAPEIWIFLERVCGIFYLLLGANWTNLIGCHI